MKNITRLLITFSLIIGLTSKIFCATATLKEIKIPAEYGWINERCEVNNSANPQPRTIICIKDAHCNYSGQKSIYSILCHLINNYGIKLIGIEGGFGYCNLSYLRDAASKEKRLEVAEQFLKENKISGAEYLDIVSDYDVLLWGIEDEALYKKNVEALYGTEKIQAELLSCLSAIKKVTEELKPLLYNKDLIELEKQETAYLNNQGIKPKDFYLLLANCASKYLVDLSEFPNFTGYINALKQGETTDYAKAGVELNTVMKIIFPKLNQKDQETLTANTKLYQEKKMSDKNFYSYFETIAQQNKITIKDYNNLSQLIAYINLISSIDKNLLYDEILLATEKAKKSLAKANLDSLTLFDISRSVDLLEKMATFKLTSSEYEELSKLKTTIATEFKPDAFLWIQAHKNNLSIKPPDNLVMIQDNLAKLEQFYLTASERDKVFLNETVGQMDKEKLNIACIITGGFHSEDLKKLFTGAGFSYICISPIVTQEQNMSDYISVLKDKFNSK